MSVKSKSALCSPVAQTIRLGNLCSAGVLIQCKTHLLGILCLSAVWSDLQSPSGSDPTPRTWQPQMWPTKLVRHLFTFLRCPLQRFSYFSAVCSIKAVTEEKTRKEGRGEQNGRTEGIRDEIKGLSKVGWKEGRNWGREGGRKDGWQERRKKEGKEEKIRKKKCWKQGGREKEQKEEDNGRTEGIRDETEELSKVG